MLILRLKFSFYNISQYVFDVKACCTHLLWNKTCLSHTGCRIDFKEVDFLFSFLAGEDIVDADNAVAI